MRVGRDAPRGSSTARVWVSVTDDGPGIAPVHLPRLTERFYRVNVASSREKGGTGLGLAIVKHILNRHRGELKIASKLGADDGPVMHIEQALAPLVKKVGWSIAFKGGRLKKWAARHPDMKVVEISPVFPVGFFKLVRIKRAL